MKKSDKLYIYNFDFDLLDFKLEPTTLILLSCIISLCLNNYKYKRTDDYSCLLDYKHLSELTGLPTRTVKANLKLLEEKGEDFLYKEERDKDDKYIVIQKYQLPLSKDKFKGFYIPLSILNKKELTYSEKLLLGYILSYGLKDKDFFVQNDSIKKLLNIKTNKVISGAIKKFKDLGLVDVTYSKGKNTNLPIKRSIKLNKDKYTNYIEKIEINIDNTKNITNNMTYNDYRVINNNHYDNPTIFIFKSEKDYEEFIKEHDIKDITIKNNT